MRYPPRALLLAASFALAFWHPDSHARTAVAADFDRQAAEGLPRSFTLPGGGADGADIAVELQSRLGADVEYPDGSHAVTYTGTADGKPSVFTRLGDDLAVDVANDDADGERAPRRSRRSIVEEGGFEAGLVDWFTPTFDDDPLWYSDGGAGDPDTGLRFWIFVHDASGETNYAKFHNWYIAWWLRDMAETVVPGVPIKVIIRREIPGVTDVDYMAGSQAEQLSRFGRRANDYLHSIGADPTRLTKTMLFIGTRPGNWGSAFGIAQQGRSAAIASGWGPRHIVAHEFGHTIGAVHEKAELRTCATNMKGYVFAFFSCQVYTKANNRLIREYVSQNTDR